MERSDDDGSGGYSAGIGRVGVGDDDIEAASLNAAQFLGRLEAAAKLVVLARAEHDHAAAQGQLGVGYGSKFTFIDGVALEPKYFAEPIDGGGRVAVAMAGDNGAAKFRHGESSAPILPLTFHGSNRLFLRICVCPRGILYWCKLRAPRSPMRPSARARI